MLAAASADMTPNQIRKRYGIPLGEPIPEEIMLKARPAVEAKKAIQVLDRAASTALLFFHRYHKGNAQQAWELLSPEVQSRSKYHKFRSRCRRAASKLSPEEPSARVAAVIGQRYQRIIETPMSDERIEKIRRWNRLNRSIIVYLHPLKPPSEGDPQMFVVKSIDGQLKIAVLPNY